MIEKIKQRKNDILAFLIPLFLLLLLFFALGFFFHDGKSIFVCDLNAQYKSLYSYYKEHFFSLFSFEKGIGGSMIGTFAYYLASPFLLLLFLFPTSKLYLATLLILVLKLCTAGFTMYLFLKSHFKERTCLLIFSTSYVFMSYIGAYFFHIMWMDAIYMLPLVMLGIDKIIRNRKPLFYIVSLMITILTNYYMGYIVCIFSLLYFCYELYLYNDNKIEKKKCFIMFTISSLLGGLLTSFLILPTAIELTSSVRTSVNPFSGISVQSFLKVASGLFLGSHNYGDILSKQRYHIYVGIFCFILYLLYFWNPKISKKEKKASFILLFIFLISIFINYIDVIWCAFSITACFSGRYMFVFCFFLIFLAVKSFLSIQYIKVEHLFFIAPLYPILAILVLWKQFSFVKTFLVFISVLIFFFYLFLLYYYLNRKDKRKQISFLLFFLVLAEVTVNFFFMMESYKFQYKTPEVDLYKKVRSEIQKIDQKQDDFYRLEKMYNRSVNDGFYLDYHGVQVFLSTLSEKQYNFFIRLGYSVFGNIIEYNRSMPPADSLLGVQYLFLRDREHPYYDKIDSFPVSYYDNLFYNLKMSDISIYENQYALGLGTIISKKQDLCLHTGTIEDRLAYQNDIVSCLNGKKVLVYEKIPLKKVSENRYILTKDKEYNIYFYPNIVSSFLEEEDTVELFIDGKTAGIFTSNDFVIQELIHSGINKDFTIELKSKSGSKYIPYAYYFREDIYQQVFSKLKQNQMKVLENKGGFIKAKVNVQKGNDYLFTTIPYDTGFTVFVDGKKVSYEEILDTFIGISLEKGEHEIVFRYMPKGLKIGALLSFIAFVITILYVKREGRLF